MRGRWLQVVVVALSTLAMGGCDHEKDGVSTVARPDYCPAEGATVPLAQLIAQIKRFKGCAVDTDATLMGPYTMGGNFTMPSCGKKGRTLFQVGVPGGTAQPLGMFAAVASVPDGQANALFAAPGNTTVRLHGEMVYKGAMLGTDLGGMSRCFEASTVSVASAK
jgi:hypothetical protein